MSGGGGSATDTRAGFSSVASDASDEYVLKSPTFSPTILSGTTSTIGKLLDIDIKKVDNGYIVTPAYRPGIISSAPVEPLAVFNDFYDMCNWLRVHFMEPEPED